MHAYNVYRFQDLLACKAHKEPGTTRLADLSPELERSKVRNHQKKKSPPHGMAPTKEMLKTPEDELRWLAIFIGDWGRPRRSRRRGGFSKSSSLGSTVWSARPFQSKRTRCLHGAFGFVWVCMLKSEYATLLGMINSIQPRLDYSVEVSSMQLHFTASTHQPLALGGGNTSTCAVRITDETITY